MAKTAEVSWEAKEYLEEEKQGWWFVFFALIVLALAGLALWLKQYSFLILIIAATAATLVYVLRPPRTLHYTLSDKGVKEGNNFYAFNKFKSFDVVKEKNHYAIVLVPRARFALNLRVYFPEKQGEEIVDMFGAKLPMEKVKLDFLDKLVQLLRI